MSFLWRQIALGRTPDQEELTRKSEVILLEMEREER